MVLGSPGQFAQGTPFDPGSPQAASIATLFSSALILCAAVFFVVAGLVAYCVVRFRDVGTRQASQVEGHVRLEVAWTVVPVLTLAWLMVLTVRAMAASDPPEGPGPDVTIIGHQWWWEVKYPSGVVTANEIHIPIGKALAFRVESADVIHDFWVPELGRKIDAIPGRPVTVWLEADTPGSYAGACAEFCGAEHAWMRILVAADTEANFDAWTRQQLAPAVAPLAGRAMRGANTFRAMTCINCHAVASADRSQSRPQIGPDLTHFAGRTTFGAGVRLNTAENLSAWLLDPQLIKPGCHMPNAQLTAAQVADLVFYFETLR